MIKHLKRVNKVATKRKSMFRHLSHLLSKSTKSVDAVIPEYLTRPNKRMELMNATRFNPGKELNKRLTGNSERWPKAALQRSVIYRLNGNGGASRRNLCPYNKFISRRRRTLEHYTSIANEMWQLNTRLVAIVKYLPTAVAYSVCACCSTFPVNPFLTQSFYADRYQS